MDLFQAFDFKNIVTTIIINISISVLFYSLFFFIVMAIKQKYLKRTWNKNNLKLFFILSGFITSFLSPIFFYISINLNIYSIFLSQIIIYFLLSIFTSWFLLIGIFPIFLTVSCIRFLLPNFNVNIEFLIYIILSYIVIWLFSFILEKIKLNRTTYIFAFIITLFLFMILISYLLFDYSLFINNFINEISNILLFVILYVISLYLQNLIRNTFKLKIHIQYDNDIFVNNSYSEIAINDFIKSKEICKGIFFKINIDNSFNKDDYEEKLINELFKNFKNECLYFKTYKNKYCLFFPIEKNESIDLKKIISNNYQEKRDNRDFLFNYEFIFKKINNELNMLNDKKINFFCHALIYGIHYCNFQKIISILDNENNFKSEKNIIQMFNCENINYFYEEKKNFLAIKNNYNLYDLELSLDEIELSYFFIDKYEKFLVVHISKNDENNIDISEYLQTIQNAEVKKYIVRNFAARSLKLLSKLVKINENYNYKLILEYSIYHLESDEFSLEEILKYFYILGLKINSVIFNFDFKNYNDQYIKQNFYNNLKLMKQKGFLISFSNVEKNNLIKYEFCVNEIDYFFLNNNSYIDKKIKSKKIKYINFTH